MAFGSAILCLRILASPGYFVLGVIDVGIRLSDSSGEISYGRQYNLVDRHLGVSRKTTVL